MRLCSLGIFKYRLFFPLELAHSLCTALSFTCSPLSQLEERKLHLNMDLPGREGFLQLSMTAIWTGRSLDFAQQ